MTEKGKLFVVAGPSGAGKTTVIRRALDSVPMHLSVSATTRKPRPGETDGIDYLFVSEEEFKRLVAADAFLEWEEVYGNRYGTLKSHVNNAVARGENVLLEIDVKGALAVKCKVPDAHLVFITPPSRRVLKDRLEGRETDDTSEISKRLDVAPWELEVGERDFDEVIVNDDLDEAVARLVSVLRGEKA
jgi:guanylate kinase